MQKFVATCSNCIFTQKPKKADWRVFMFYFDTKLVFYLNCFPCSVLAKCVLYSKSSLSNDSKIHKLWDGVKYGGRLQAESIHFYLFHMFLSVKYIYSLYLFLCFFSSVCCLSNWRQVRLSHRLLWSFQRV